MILEQQESFRLAALPLVKWLQDNVHPHHSAIVTSFDAELLEGKCMVITEPDKLWIKP